MLYCPLYQLFIVKLHSTQYHLKMKMLLDFYFSLVVCHFGI